MEGTSSNTVAWKRPHVVALALSWAQRGDEGLPEGLERLQNSVDVLVRSRRGGSGFAAISIARRCGKGHNAVGHWVHLHEVQTGFLRISR